MAYSLTANSPGLLNRTVLLQMNYLHFTIALLLASSGALSAQESDFRVKLSGVLASKLSPDAQLFFSSPFSKTSPTYAIAELPIRLPFEQFHGHHWHVFFDSKKPRSSFSVTLSADLFDKPRVIDIKLDAPRPRIRPIFSLLGRDIKYSASISQRMEYRDLPYWDNKRQSLTRSRPPKMRIVALKNDRVIHDKEMGDSCMASKWFAFIDPDIKLNNGDTYRMSVTYDSGGLFPMVTTQRDFTYHEELHGG